MSYIIKRNALWIDVTFVLACIDSWISVAAIENDIYIGVAANSIIG